MRVTCNEIEEQVCSLAISQPFGQYCFYIVHRVRAALYYLYVTTLYIPILSYLLLITLATNLACLCFLDRKDLPYCPKQTSCDN